MPINYRNAEPRDSRIPGRLPGMPQFDPRKPMGKPPFDPRKPMGKPDPRRTRTGKPPKDPYAQPGGPGFDETAGAEMIDPGVVDVLADRVRGGGRPPLRRAPPDQPGYNPGISLGRGNPGGGQMARQRPVDPGPSGGGGDAPGPSQVPGPGGAPGGGDPLQDFSYRPPGGGGTQAAIDPNTGQTIIGHNVIPDKFESGPTGMLGAPPTASGGSPAGAPIGPGGLPGGPSGHMGIGGNANNGGTGTGEYISQGGLQSGGTQSLGGPAQGGPASRQIGQNQPMLASDVPANRGYGGRMGGVMGQGDAEWLANNPNPGPPQAAWRGGTGQPMQSGGTQSLGAPANNSGGAPWQTPIPRIGQTDPGGQTRIEDALMDRYRRIADPYFDRQEGRLSSRLANQGLPTSGEAYQDEFGQFNDTRNRSFNEAANQAILAGTAEDQRLFNNQFAQNQLGLQENLGQRGLDVQMRGQDIQEALGRAGIDMQGQQLTAQQAIARLQLEASQGNNAAQREMGRLQMGESRRQYDLNMQFNQGQQGWENAYRDRGWMFDAGLAGRNQFFNEMGSFFPGAPMLGMPNVPQLDATGAYSIGAQTDANRYQGEFDQWNAANQYNAGLWGGLTDLGGAWLGRP